MTKFRILDVPDVSPGICANCGSSKNDGRKYIDIGRDIEWYGALYLCTLCLNELATYAGLFDKLKDELYEALQLQNELEELKADAKRLHETVLGSTEQIKEVYASIHSVELPSDSDGSDVLVSEETKSGTDQTEQPAVAAQSGTTKSTPVSGRKNVRSITDLLES